MTERDVQATERGCPACGHDMANHYEDANVRWCANCERPCEGTADEYDAAWREAWAVHRAVKWWQQRGFADGIPDESPYELEAARKAPSWRRVCKSLLRNDYWGKGLGFSQHKSDAYKAYLDLMRRRREAWGVDESALQLPFDAVEELADHA